MTHSSQTIPFVDLSWQHRPLQADIQAVVTQALAQGDFVLGVPWPSLRPSLRSPPAVPTGWG